MRVTTKYVFNMVTGEVLEHEWYEYDGPVAECKGEKEAAAQMKRSNDLQEGALNRMYQTQDYVKGNVGKYLTGDIGYSPEQVALLNSMLLGQLSQSYNDAGSNVRSALLRRGSGGGDAPVGGDYVRGIASLEGGLASDRASGLANIQLQNLQQALNNKFNAASLINGQAAQLTSPIATFGSQSSNALNQYMQAANSGFGATFARSFGGALGGGLGAWISGGGFKP